MPLDSPTPRQQQGVGVAVEGWLIARWDRRQPPRLTKSLDSQHFPVRWTTTASCRPVNPSAWSTLPPPFAMQTVEPNFSVIMDIGVGQEVRNMQDPGALPALRHPAEGRPEDAALADFPLEDRILVALVKGGGKLGQWGVEVQHKGPL